MTLSPSASSYPHHLKHVTTASHLSCQSLHQSLPLPNASAEDRAAEVGAAFLKTYIAFSGVVATRENVRLTSGVVEGYGWWEGERVKVKASGGARTFKACVEIFKTGAELILNVNFSLVHW